MPEKLLLPPDQASYKVNRQGGVVSTRLDGGLARRRADIANPSSIVNCQWTLDQGQFQYFEAFYAFNTNYGATTFLIDLIIGQPFLEQYEASFVEDSYTIKTKGLTYYVEADLEVVPVTDLALAGLLVALFEVGNGALVSLAELVNEDLDVT